MAKRRYAVYIGGPLDGMEIESIDGEVKLFMDENGVPATLWEITRVEGYKGWYRDTGAKVEVGSSETNHLYKWVNKKERRA
jgi:hypothetical protein